MSKSSGEFVTLDELLSEVGTDSARYFFLMRSSDTHLNFDLDLAKSRDNGQPGLLCAVCPCPLLRKADDPRASSANPLKADAFEGDLETELAKAILDFPEEVLGAANSRAPNRIAAYAEKLSACFHSFYHDCRVLGEEQEVADRRMLLVLSTKKVIASALSILGVSAPERM